MDSIVKKHHTENKWCNLFTLCIIILCSDDGFIFTQWYWSSERVAAWYVHFSPQQILPLCVPKQMVLLKNAAALWPQIWITSHSNKYCYTVHWFYMSPHAHCLKPSGTLLQSHCNSSQVVSICIKLLTLINSVAITYFNTLLQRSCKLVGLPWS